MKHRFSPLAVLAVALGACADAPEANVAAAVDTAGDVPRLTYPAERAAALPWSLDTVAAIGGAMAEDAYQFGQINADRVAGDGAGSYYVLDRQGQRILKYDPSGAHLATYGRGGEGPGELNQPGSIDVAPDDTIWVTDFSNRRMSGFPQDGGDAVSVPYRDDTDFPAGPLLATAGGFFQTFRQFFVFGAGGAQDPDETREIPLVRMDRSGRPVQTLWAAPEPPTKTVTLQSAGRMMVMLVTQEFWPDFQWTAFSDGTVVVSDTAAYHLRFLRPDGGIERVVAREPAPRTATEEDREFIRERAREQSLGGYGAQQPDQDTQERMLEERLSKMTFADVIPRIVTLRVDGLDRLWVGVSVDEPGEIGRIDVYDRDGTLLGELHDFPMPDVFTGTHGVGLLQQDELDVQQLVVARLVEEGAAAGN